MNDTETSFESRELLVSKKMNKFAVTSIVSGIIGLIISPLCIVAVICGITGLLRVSKIKSGKGLSIVGVIVGIVATVLWPMKIHFINMELRTISMTNLYAIGKGFQLYESAYQVYPDNLNRLIECGYASSKMFKYPGEETRDSYVLIMPVAGMSQDTIIGYENKKYVYNGKVLVLYLNGNVADMPLEELHIKLTEQNAKMK